MRTCTNCGATITCGCQDRIASDGKKVCTTCSVKYEQELIIIKAQDIINQNSLGQNENATS